MLRKLGIFSVLILALAGGLYLQAYFAQRRSWAQIQQRLDAIRAAGQPVTAQDLAKLYPDPPPEKDAGLLLAPAINLLSFPDFAKDVPLVGHGSLPPREKPFDSQIQTNIRALLLTNEIALNAVPWNRITNAWIGSGFINGFTNLTEFRLSPFIRLTGLLCLGAMDDAQSGRDKDAARKLLRNLALLQIMHGDILTHQLVLRVGEYRSCDALEWVLNHTTLSADDLSRLQNALADDHPESFGEALVNLRCQDIAAVETIRSLPVDAFSMRELPDNKLLAAIKAKFFGSLMWLSGKVYSDDDYLKMLEARENQISALKLPPKQRFPELLRLQKAITNQFPESTFIAGLTMIRTDLTVSERHEMETVAKLRASELAVSLERWRQNHDGRLPETLSELVPQVLTAVPADPFDGEQMRYKKLGHGYVVYSIGPDFTDDGGKEKSNTAQESEHYDITFVVER